MKKVAKKTLRKLKQHGIDYQLVPESSTVRHLPVKTNLTLHKFSPLTLNQKLTYQYYESGSNLMLHGLAGTGKTFISMYLALDQVLNAKDYKKVYIVRSVVPTRDIGFLPGSAKEKCKAYELPYYAICSELFSRGDSYEILKTRGVIEFITTSFIRGITLNNCVVIVDECQNLNFHELDSVITRVGDNCKIVFCGDFTQSDLKSSEGEGINKFINIIKRVDNFSYVEFSEDDIVRSGLVKQYIITKDRLK